MNQHTAHTNNANDLWSFDRRRHRVHLFWQGPRSLADNLQVPDESNLQGFVAPEGRTAPVEVSLNGPDGLQNIPQALFRVS